ncbi:MAG: tRNA-(ms[2]io[6]A)-hydroxylase [Bacteroidota bacterium]|nr:tRNA-(ms[2]io[6]A)-hydroxylase [Bacteroidota bacterium]
MIVNKSLLGLHLPTDPRWADIAMYSIAEILTDHAYCEQKAASTCISLIVLHPENEELVEKLSPIVTEEWGHFRSVLKELKRRGYKLGRQRKDEYVNSLLKFVQKGGTRQSRLMDLLLMAALIEARSCERFKLLSQKIQDADLQKFYYDLMTSEAGHYRLFLELAKSAMPEPAVKKRWNEWLSFEAEVITGLEVRGDRVH